MLPTGVMAAGVSLSAPLADALPKDLSLRVYHVSTRPTPVGALFSASPHQTAQKTHCEKHLLSIALPHAEGAHELLVFAIEILIFTTRSLTTIFVSKADSTGFLDLLKLDRAVGSVIRSISTAFLRFLVNARLAGPPIVLSLFARSQSQYLFPGSVEYAGKHVLDDRQLIKWWCKTLDPLVDSSNPSVSHPSSPNAAYVLVPGCDKSETRAFFPPSARQSDQQSAKWHASYPMELLVPDSSAPLRCLIPRLPDDPKSRFLTDLDDSKDDKGQWRSVKTMEQFWDLMSYRQECSAGRLVGFVWVVFGKQEVTATGEATNRHAAGMPERETASKTALLPIPGELQPDDNSMDLLPGLTAPATDHMAHPSTPPLTSPVLPPHEPETLEAGDPDAEAAEQYYDDSQTLPVAWPESSRGELIIGSEQYDALVGHLLQLDFSTQLLAEKGTSSFVAKTSELAGKPWGISVTGRKERSERTEAVSVPKENGVNILTTVRKKRKVDVADEKLVTSESAVNTLGAGLVRKKAKT